MPRDVFERVLRRITPYHFYLCRDCNLRGWHLGPMALAHVADQIQRGMSSRPREKRDIAAARAMLARVLLSLLLAGGLGAGAGLWIHSCQARRAVLETPSDAVFP